MPDLFDNNQDSFYDNSSNYDNNISNRKKKGEKSKLPDLRILLFIVFFGAVFFTVGLVFLLIQNEGIRNGIEVTATVIDWVEEKDSDGDIIYAHKYEYSIGGQVYHAVSNSSSSNPAKIGSQKTIYVDKNDYNKIFENQPWLYFFLCVGALIIIISITSYIIIRKKKMQRETNSGY